MPSHALQCPESHLINLRHHGIQHFTLEWPKNNSLVLHWIHNKPSARLYQTGTDVVYCCHCYHKPISA